MADNTFNGYEETIESFSFNEKGSIKLPKEVREKAYSLSIDISIDSTLGRDYLNYKSNPPHGFYGYAILVFRNYSLIKVPIENPKQNLFYERVEEAYVNWYALYMQAMVNLSYITRQNVNYLIPICQDLNIAVEADEQGCPQFSGFEEIPLREVYIQTKYGTRFSLEVSYWSPVPVKYGSCEYDGKSQQADDPEKDNGLDEDDYLPDNTDNEENPYAGLPPASTQAELGAFYNDKFGTGIVVPPQPLKYIATLYAEGYPYGCAAGKYRLFIPISSPLDESPIVQVQVLSTELTCNSQVRTNFNVIVNGAIAVNRGAGTSYAVGVIAREGGIVEDGFFYDLKPV